MSTGSMNNAISTSPLFIISYTASAVAVCNTIWTSGYFSLYVLHIFANVSTAANSPHPMVIVPSTTSSFPFSSSIVLSSRLRISRARLFNKIPSSVSEIFFPLRINNVIPRSSSNAAICLDSVGWVICNCSAAFVKLCSFATVRK